MIIGRAFAIGFALVALITFADWISSPVQPCEVTIQPNSEANRKPNSAKENCSAGKIITIWRIVGILIDRWHDDLAAMATVVIAIFTVVLVIVTNRQARLTREAIDISNREFISTHRPKLRVRQFVLEPPASGSPLIIRFATINVGETVARWRNIAAEVALWNGSFWEAPGINQIAEPNDGPPVRSGQRVQMTIHSRFNATAEQISAIVNGGLIVCAVGEFAYADDLGTTRRTGFRRNYNVRTDMFEASPNTDQEYED